ncbi:MAG: hypothetical protein ACLQU2_17395 [Candidatus Binataceae bacterium]
MALTEGAPDHTAMGVPHGAASAIVQTTRETIGFLDRGPPLSVCRYTGRHNATVTTF